ncbi:hypothetical protein G9P44_004704 [Scheffersomyces stipitis]|nr:hypothetical protein G9P44_004704 [Scheffersomyces stipitis]
MIPNLYRVNKTKLPRVLARSVRFQSSLAIHRYDDNYTTLVFDGDRSISFSNIFLRDSCREPKSVDTYSSQKLFTTAEIAKNLSINSPPRIRKSPDSSESVLEIEWLQNGKLHLSQYQETFLREYIDAESRQAGKFFEGERTIWDNKELVGNLPSIQADYKKYLESDSTFFETVRSLNKFGLAFVNDIPEPSAELQKSGMNEKNAAEWPVSKLANKFGYIKKTFYGTLFDVKNEKEEAKNIANTNTFLPLHMDLLYYESPPGLQLLHFIKNSTTGGENVFCDSFLAAEHVKNVDPTAYVALTLVPITYHYDNNNEHYFFKRPLVVEEVKGDTARIKEVNYAPPFQGPFEFGITRNDSEREGLFLAKDTTDGLLFQDFIRGFQLFEDFINDPVNHYEIKMPEGSCVIFDNRRVLHSRLGFSDSNGGDRWLMGTYVDGDSFRSKLRMGFRHLKEAM